MGMRDTKDRNGILFFVVPSRRRFVVLGDEGIHRKVGQDFWDKLVAAMSERLQGRQVQRGADAGIAECGRLLAVHFPYQGETDVNELPDDIDFGDKE